MPQVFKLRINHNTCSGCNVCVNVCPLNHKALKKEDELTRENAVILVKNGIARPIFIEERAINCDGCGICQKECPQDAIKIEIVKY